MERKELMFRGDMFISDLTGSSVKRTGFLVNVDEMNYEMTRILRVDIFSL